MLKFYISVSNTLEGCLHDKLIQFFVFAVMVMTV